MRLVDGRIITEIPCGRVHETCAVIVPSFGAIVDSFLDAFGYRTSAILQLYDAVVDSETCDQFVEHLSEYKVAKMEANWLWSMIDDEALTARRYRSYPVF